MLLERLREELDALGHDRAEAEPLLAEVESRLAAARAAAVEALSSERYLRLLDRLDVVAEPELSGASMSLADIWGAEAKRTRKAFKRLSPKPADDELHGARIRVKRARYAAELAAPELGWRGADFVDAAKRLQDVLGTHQDAVVAEQRVREWAASDPTGCLAAGRLIERARTRKAAAREAWPEDWRRMKRAAKKAKR